MNELINKLKQNDRIEFYLKKIILDNTFSSITQMIGVLAVINFIVLNITFSITLMYKFGMINIDAPIEGIVASFVIYCLVILLMIFTFLNNKKKENELFQEYFKIETK